MKPVQKVLTTILWVATVLIMVSIIGAGLWKRADKPLEVIGEVPYFELVDQDNKPVNVATLRGKPWIADFVFTNCGGPCPMMTAKMAKLQKEIPSSGVRFVSFSVDPERDTPAVLKEYAAKFQADESRWKFLTGEKEAVFAAARGMLITAMPADEKNPIIHSEKFVLVDSGGRIRRYYDSKDEAAMSELKRDAMRLAQEAGDAGH